MRMRVREPGAQVGRGAAGGRQGSEHDARRPGCEHARTRRRLRAHLSGETMKRIAQSRLADGGVPDNEHGGLGWERRLAAARARVFHVRQRGQAPHGLHVHPHRRAESLHHDRAVARRTREGEE
jgi:hypothetical protein